MCSLVVNHFSLRVTKDGKKKAQLDMYCSKCLGNRPKKGLSLCMSILMLNFVYSLIYCLQFRRVLLKSIIPPRSSQCTSPYVLLQRPPASVFTRSPLMSKVMSKMQKRWPNSPRAHPVSLPLSLR